MRRKRTEEAQAIGYAISMGIVFIILILLGLRLDAQTISATELRMKPKALTSITGSYRMGIDPTTFKFTCKGPGGANCMPATGAVTLTVADLPSPFNTPTNNTLLIGNGSVWTASLMPSCTASASRLKFTLSTNVFTCAANTAQLDVAQTFTATQTFGNVVVTGTCTGCGGGGSGTVTSVAMTMPGAIFNTTVSGSPVTTSGTLAPSLLTQTANTFLAGPTSGGSLAPTFRAIVAGDIPTLNQSTTGTAANITGIAAIANGGTGQSAKVAAFNALSPNTTLGDVTYHNGTDSTRLAGNITTNKKFFTQTGNGSVSAAPVWSTIAAGDVPTLNQSTTGNAATATALAADGSNCPAGQYPLGVDASGNVQTCTADVGGTVPTGTGFTHITAGAQDAASKKVDLAAAADVTGTLPIANGGTANTTAAAGFAALAPTPTDDALLVGSGSAWVGTVMPSCAAAGARIKYSITTNTFTCAANTAVTDADNAFTVAQTAPDFATTNSRTANTFLAAPNGSAGAAAFRAIVAADVPTLNQTTTGNAANVTGIVAIANGGTGASTQQAAFDAISVLTTKGDLHVYGTNNTRLPVGTNGRVLTADSTQSLGVAWQDNNFIYSDTSVTTLTGTAADANLYTTSFTMAAGRCVQAYAVWTFSTATAVAKIMRWKFGSTAVNSYSSTSTASTGLQGNASIIICNAGGSTTSQQIAPGMGAYGTALLGGAASSTGSNDTSVSVTLSFIFNAGATEVATRRLFMVEYIR